MIHHKLFGVIFVILLQTSLFGQSFDLDNLTKPKKPTINGRISATSVFYNSNLRKARAPFTYFLRGNLNFSWLSFSMPVSYSLTNKGNHLDYKIPFDLNRLSVHPKYKWVKAHIGDINSSFSPYTLNGHQYTGIGLDITPTKQLTINIMGGRLLKATEDDGNEKTIPSFNRYGYGSKIQLRQDKYILGGTVFYAKDEESSVQTKLDHRNIFPQENIVGSVFGSITLSRNLRVNAEYSSTAITRDIRAIGRREVTHFSTFFINDNESTQYYDVVKAGIDFNVAATQLGIQYERVDPGYQTLGAYYFNNDFENITLKGTRALFDNKVNLAFNVGYQRNDLAGQKLQSTSRFVGSINGTIKATERFIINGSYSNFSSYTNQKLNQFDDINDYDLTDEDIEALDYKQLSQNANANINWNLVKKKHLTQGINFNYSLSSSANVQGGTIGIGQATNFHNTNASYTIGLPKKSLAITSNLNFTYADIGENDAVTYGAAISISKKLFHKILNSKFTFNYNNSNSSFVHSSILNFRLNLSTAIAKKHNINFSLLQLFRNSTHQSFNEFTATLGYSYSFHVIGAKNTQTK